MRISARYRYSIAQRSVLLGSLLLSACATTTTDLAVDRVHEKTLAIAAQNDLAIFTLIALPLQFYCHKQRWPTEKSFAVMPDADLLAVRDLHYYPQNTDYRADFNLISAVEHDPFITRWQMTIPPPATANTDQRLSIMLSSPDNAIFLTLEYEFHCVDYAMNYAGVFDDKNTVTHR